MMMKERRESVAGGIAGLSYFFCFSLSLFPPSPPSSAAADFPLPRLAFALAFALFVAVLERYKRAQFTAKKTHSKNNTS